MTLSLLLGACGLTDSNSDEPGGKTSADDSGGSGSKTEDLNSGGAQGDGSLSGGTGGTDGDGSLSGGTGGESQQKDSVGGSDNAGGASTGGSSSLVCPDSIPPPGYEMCRTQADCSNGKICQFAPSTAPSCGACFTEARLCNSDADCVTEARCVEIPPDPCPCGNEIGTQCLPACSADSCESDEVCRDDGHCTPAACDADEITCSIDRVCEPARDFADKNGCALSSCVSDGLVCPEHTRCDQESVTGRGCVPIHCGELDRCPINFECDPEGAGNGCAPQECQVDSDCECGVCINDHCQNRLNLCTSPPAP